MKKNRDGRYLLSGVILAGLLIGVVFLLRLGQPKLPTLPENFPRAKGSLNAPIQIIEFSDFECPACKMAQPILEDLVRRYPGKIRLVYLHFPLEGHRWAPLAHRAAECAARQNRFWVYHDFLYAGQPDWTGAREAPIEVFVRYALQGGLESGSFAQCLADSRTDAKIREERLSGMGLGVQSTPSFFVNGDLAIGGLKLREEVEKWIRR